MAYKEVQCMEMSKDYKMSKRLNDFLDKALEEAEEQEKYWTDERIEKHSEDFQKIVLEEITELEKNIDNLSNEEKEYLKWLKKED